MFDDLIAAFGLTVVLCMAPSLLIALAFPPILLRITRPKAPAPAKNAKPQKNTPAKPQEAPKRGFWGTLTALAQFYLLSLILLIMGSILFWWGYLSVSGSQEVIDFAAETFPVEREVIEEAVEVQELAPPSQD